MKLDNDPAKQPSSKVERGGKIRECTGLECTVQKADANERIQGELKESLERRFTKRSKVWRQHPPYVIPKPPRN